MFLIAFLFIQITQASIFENVERKVGVSFGSGQVSNSRIHHYALDLQYLYPTWKELKLGFGPRMTHLYSSQIRTVDDQSEFLENINLTAFNLAFYSEYEFENISLGFNIDMIGLTLGKSALLNKTQKISPRKFNALLGGEADRGTLNSEFWLGTYWRNHLLRLGLAHEVVEFSGQSANNKRRQKFFDVIFFSVARAF